METINKNEKAKFGGFSGSTLKLVAIFCMLIDHIGASIIEPMINLTMPFNDYLFNPPEVIDVIYIASRTIGRIAFPLFCFLIVQGFIHTKDVKKYAVRLGAFALISEIPFDLALRQGQFFDWSYQNVYFTLLIGLITIYLISLKNDELLWIILFGAMGCAAAELIKSDYGMMGIIPIVLIYALRDTKIKTAIAVLISFAFEALFFLAVYSSIPLIFFYNGKRGLKMKYFFYAFYPGHLLLIYLVKTFLLKM